MVGRGDIQMADIPAIKEDLNALQVLSNELIGKDTPEIEIDRQRTNDGHLNYLENDTSTYGRSLRQTRQKYAGNVHDYKPQLGLNDCNPELSEVEKVVVLNVAKIVEQN